MKAFAALLAALACLLVLPAAALAAEFTVDSTADEADAGGLNGICLSTGLKCTLRAAIEESNSSTGVKDTIKFAANPFNGQLADTIAIATSLPLIVDPVHVDGDSGGQCVTEAGQSGPCAGVNGPAAGSALSAQADGVEIDGLAITGAAGTGAAGIRAFGAEGLVARGNWLGVKLDGSAGPNSKGIYLDPDSNGATIGGTAVADRNVIANNSFEGLDIEGASDTDVLGNYFGVKPDGTTAAANVGKNIEITDGATFEAAGNEVGTTVASGNAPCDGGCNVIAGSTFGIDLQGNEAENEEPATGPTTIHGNFIGLNAAGTSTVANNAGVNVGSAEDVRIGGAENADANFIAGGAEGVPATDAEGLEVVGNIIGSGAPGAEISAPGKGVWLLTGGNANRVAVSGNTFDMDGGVAVQVHFGGTDIVSNFIEGAELGVWTKVGPNAAGGNLIEDNVIGESIANGLRIEDSGNFVFGNSIYGSGAAGIRLQAPAALLHATENQIGGDTAASENTIREGAGDAIEIDNAGEEEPSQNEVARNRGDSNGGFFIDLVGATTNGGILPPTFGTPIQSSATGTAEPGALVRVFRKKAVEAGELESFLGEAVADGSGNWKVAYPGQIPIGTIVAATQTNTEGGTSELKMTVTAADPSSGGGGAGGGTAKDDKGKDDQGKGGKAKDDKGQNGGAIDTKIVKGPRGRIHSTTAKFRFSSNEKGAKFECRLDRRKFKPCKSPKTYKKLKPGKHVFKVRAVKGKRVDSTPAKRKFKVLK